MMRLAKAPPMIKMKRKSIIAEHFDSLIMMPIHVAYEKIKDGHVHEIKKPAASSATAAGAATAALPIHSRITNFWLKIIIRRLFLFVASRKGQMEELIFN